jgi:hypothetical protein
MREDIDTTTVEAMNQAQEMFNEIGKKLDVKIEVGPKEGLVDVQYRVVDDCKTISATTPIAALHELCHYITSSPEQRYCNDYDLDDSWWYELSIEEAEEGGAVYDEELDEYLWDDTIKVSEMFDSVGIAANNKWMLSKLSGGSRSNDYSIRQSHIRELLAIGIEKYMIDLSSTYSDQLIPAFINEEKLNTAHDVDGFAPSIQAALNKYKDDNRGILEDMARVYNFIIDSDLESVYLD